MLKFSFIIFIVIYFHSCSSTQTIVLVSKNDGGEVEVEIKKGDSELKTKLPTEITIEEGDKDILIKIITKNDSQEQKKDPLKSLLNKKGNKSTNSNSTPGVNSILKSDQPPGDFDLPNTQNNPNNKPIDSEEVLIKEEDRARSRRSTRTRRRRSRSYQYRNSQIRGR